MLYLLFFGRSQEKCVTGYFRILYLFTHVLRKTYTYLSILPLNPFHQLTYLVVIVLLLSCKRMVITLTTCVSEIRHRQLFAVGNGSRSTFEEFCSKSLEFLIKSKPYRTFTTAMRQLRFMIGVLVAAAILVRGSSENRYHV